MRIRKVRIENLRSVKDAEVHLDGLTALAGPNGSGKSTILLALRIFFRQATVSEEDYYNKNTDEDITITVTFDCLGPAALSKFTKYVDSSGDLDISCIVHWDGTKAAPSLHGLALQNPDFVSICAEDKAGVAQPQYKALTERPDYDSLPKKWPGLQKAKDALSQWESDHPDRCRRMPDSGKFFGYAGVGYGYLGQQVRFLHVPAVRDAAADGGADKGSVLGQLLELTVQGALKEKAEYKALPGKIKDDYEKAMGAASLPELAELGRSLSATLGRFASGTRAEIDWKVPKPSIGEPRAEARLVEHDYSSPVGGAGHGLQRAFIMAALHRLSVAQPAAAAKDGGDRSGKPSEADAPSIILAIEEPELYQHPTRMRHLAGLLRSLPDGGLEGVARSIQVVYSTHSPHFVFADHVGNIRLVSRTRGRNGGPMTTAIASTTSEAILGDLKRHDAASAANEAIDHSLLQFMGPAASEGFFAETVVLVEGPSDQTALTAVAEIMGRPLDAHGVSIIPCGSKSTMHLPLALFRRLGVRVYPVWDADTNKDGQREESEKILSLLGYADNDWHGKIDGSFACLESNLEETISSDLKKALGDKAGKDPYKRILKKRRALHNIGKSASKPLKTHLVMEEAKVENIRLEVLESIVWQITRQREGNESA